MKEFLNRFATKNRNPSTAVLKQYTDLFRNTIANIDSTLGPQAFRLGGPINAAVFDSVMVGVATRLQSGKKISASSARSAYQDLMGSDEYMQAVSRATSDEGSVATRVRRAIEAFKRA